MFWDSTARRNVSVIKQTLSRPAGRPAKRQAWPSFKLMLADRAELRLCERCFHGGAKAQDKAGGQPGLWVLGFCSSV